MVVWWLGFLTFTAEGKGFISGQGNKILQTEQVGQKANENEKHNQGCIFFKYMIKIQIFICIIMMMIVRERIIYQFMNDSALISKTISGALFLITKSPYTSESAFT